MRFRVSNALRSLIVVFFILSFIVADAYTSQSQQLSLLNNGFSSSSLLSLPPSVPNSLVRKPATALIAALDGTIYLVESSSGRVIWSFPTGSPIYHSYQAPILNNNNPNNNSSGPISGLIECGDDWELIVHDSHFGKTPLQQSIADYVAFTPTMTTDGAVIVGSKISTMFEVDAKTGRLVRSYPAADVDNTLTVVWSDDGQSVTNVLSTKSNVLADPAKLNTPEFIIKIVRTDYFLKSVGPKSGMVLWTMAVAEFKAVLLCQHNENPSGSASFDAEDEYAFDSGFDFAMPYACRDRKLKEVYRQRKNFLFEPANLERWDNRDRMRTSDLMLPSQPNIDRFVPGHDGNINHKMLPVLSLQPKIGFYDSNDRAVVLHQPHMKITSPGKVDPNRVQKISYDPNDSAAVLHLPSMEITSPGKVGPNRVIDWSTALLVLLFMVFFFGFFILYQPLVVKIQLILKDQNSEPDLKSLPPKKKRARKSGKNNIIVDKQDKHLSSAEEDILTHKETNSEAWLHFNKVDGRRIGKLFVSNKEIAKGSNGTIVLEGLYEGRAVAVKRLVQTHHDVAHKEIQNLIASDCHPNIVRWYGVEYDHDFVYLALERCSCNLDDLIHIYSDISENPVFGKDQASNFFIKAQMETGRDDMQYLWKANGYPSPLLLKMMRDVVSGLVHLHELGIIHRDLKPQNVLIIKERSLCAKLSDMGISKRLLGDMSSLDHSATGCGSSGWQAPEQLVQGRQTRAVDLFSLGCVLFFCMTAGRHPFGERLERDFNIVKNQKDLFLVEFIPEAEDLISCLLNPDPDLRPKAIEVLHHPLFWSSDKRLSFLRDTSDRVELEDRETNSDLLKALESIAPVALGSKWDEKMEQAFITNIGHYRRYKFDSVRDLLRVMRNKLNHYRELPQEIQELVGPVPEGFNDYFASRFPRLLIEVYKVICIYCKDDECFQRYFRDND
ncbi:serine/threonine-protein kinase/endoribonuclease IRE1a-like [Gastrolobium bilobum]|uniref:serine/threonine-protein kinase/endoribonuclease IRE1a-like n=1 Tax=Gastrolobium bilobum TaxID=150636 RepID=UPI002AAF4878|nr:serine/threonine-protein kinase/endoribonuclease IRE1a-like [Gastrolobium bilobum]